MATPNAEHNPLAGPAWDIASEYPSVSAPPLSRDIDDAVHMITELEDIAKRFIPRVPRAMEIAGPDILGIVDEAVMAFKVHEKAMVLLWNVSTYLQCILSVDATNAEAKRMYSRLQPLQARLSQAYNPVAQFLKLTSDEIAERYLATPTTAPETFALKMERKLRDEALSLQEEDIILGLNVNGPTAFGDMYDSISGSISFELDLPDGTRRVGLSQAASLLQNADGRVRETAFRGINKAWKVHEEAVAAGLNALAGWRLQLYKRRSYKKPVHFLDGPLHSSRISRETLDAMMTAVAEVREEARRAVRVKARALGLAKLGPWDLFAPSPAQPGKEPARYPYADAIKLIAGAYGRVHGEMGDFIRMMDERRWIEAQTGPSRRPGAYCTRFAKSRTPRVYMTYAGGMRELKTLAHELGHAWHSWVMRDMPLVETFYPMTLAETASIFGETLVNNALLENARDHQDRLNVLWSMASEAEAFLLNIPVRFAFEKAFYERRSKESLTPDDLRGLMAETWTEWYGDALSEPDDMFWASKLHFSISELSFYNFPYTFGYLFALGVYAQKDKLGAGFFRAYSALLRDTGRMTAEDLAKRHLGADLTRPDFWRQSLAVSCKAVRDLEATINAGK